MFSLRCPFSTRRLIMLLHCCCCWFFFSLRHKNRRLLTYDLHKVHHGYMACVVVDLIILLSCTHIKSFICGTLYLGPYKHIKYERNRTRWVFRGHHNFYTTDDDKAIVDVAICEQTTEILVNEIFCLPRQVSKTWNETKFKIFEVRNSHSFALVLRQWNIRHFLHQPCRAVEIIFILYTLSIRPDFRTPHFPSIPTGTQLECIRRSQPQTFRFVRSFLNKPVHEAQNIDCLPLCKAKIIYRTTTDISQVDAIAARPWLTCSRNLGIFLPFSPEMMIACDLNRSMNLRIYDEHVCVGGFLERLRVAMPCVCAWVD